MMQCTDSVVFPLGLRLGLRVRVGVRFGLGLTKISKYIWSFIYAAGITKMPQQCQVVMNVTSICQYVRCVRCCLTDVVA